MLRVAWGDSFGCSDISSSDLIHLLVMLQVELDDSFVRDDTSCSCRFISVICYRSYSLIHFFLLIQVQHDDSFMYDVTNFL
jgi:hypothetical protein